MSCLHLKHSKKSHNLLSHEKDSSLLLIYTLHRSSKSLNKQVWNDRTGRCNLDSDILQIQFQTLQKSNNNTRAVKYYSEKYDGSSSAFSSLRIPEMSFSGKDEMITNIQSRSKFLSLYDFICL